MREIMAMFNPFNLTPLERKQLGERAKKGGKTPPVPKRGRIKVSPGTKGLIDEFGTFIYTPGVVQWGRRGGNPFYQEVTPVVWDKDTIATIQTKKEKPDDRTAAEKWADEWSRNQTPTPKDTRDESTSNTATRRLGYPPGTFTEGGGGYS